MKIPFPCIVTSFLLVSGCAGSAQNQVDAQAPVAASSASSAYKYRCVSGETIAATYTSTDSATVRYKDDNYNMHIAVSGSGARYVGGGLEWWTKGAGPGSEGTLFRHRAGGTSGESLELCTAF